MRVVVAFDEPYPAGDLVLVPDRNLITGVKELRSQLGSLSTLEVDLLLFAAAVFAADIAAKRGERELITRDFQLCVPVVNLQAFQRHKDQIENILYLLSDDNWDIEFIARTGPSEPMTMWPTADGRTLLFSGGLDSFAASVDLLDAQVPLQLASHYTANPVIKGSQETLFAYLKDQYGDTIRRIAARVTGQKSNELLFPADAQREPTQRTRSFMFLVIAALAARRSGYHELVMIAENGQMAIHLPLTNARLGAFSTHTAHPEVVHEMQEFLSGLLAFRFVLTNPFLYKTKAECIGNLVLGHRPAIESAVSCWKSSRQALSHCGACVPCLVRRIALEHHGVRLAEYVRDLFVEDIGALSVDDVGKRNLTELCEFITWFGGEYTDAELRDEFPDLINEHVDAQQAIAMYRRSAGEAREVLRGYQNVQRILG